MIGHLLELRYIALCIKARGSSSMWKATFTLPTSIEKLESLETLIVHNRNKEGLRVPKEIWMSYRLRHLILKGNIAHEHSYLPDKLRTLSHLQTLSYRFPPEHCEKILEFTPNLRKLGINADLYLSSTKLMIPNLDKLKHLENLCVQNDLNSGIPSEDKLLYRELSGPTMFPVTLKKMTLVGTSLKWDEMQKIGMLPNLEVLKLQFEAFRGGQWETNDGGFRRLKHLAFKFIKIVQWIAYSDQFPNLEHLKLDECHQLEEIPIGIGDIYTLEMIEIRNCNQAVAQSSHKIKEDQMSKGNDLLKISIFQA